MPVKKQTAKTTTSKAAPVKNDKSKGSSSASKSSKKGK